MQKLSLVLLLVFSCFFCNAQVNVNADCIDAIPLCTTPNFTFYSTSGAGSVNDFSVASSVSNPTNNPFPPNNGCLKAGELNPQWLLITVGNAGMLEFVFGAANSANPQAGCYDWIMWPYSPNTCANIFNNTLAPIRCNWNSTCSNGTGIASPTNIVALGGNSGDFEPPLPVNACQQFIICISNYSGVNSLVSFQSIGTASLSCNPNCNPNYSMCAGTSATIVPVNYAALSNPVFSIIPGGTTNTTGSFVVSPTVTTNYTTFITGTNQVNAVQTITAISTVTVKAQPGSIPTLTQSSCTNSLTSFNLGLTFTPSVGAPSYTVNWSPLPNGVSSATQISGTAYIPGGTYNATVTAAGGCSVVSSFSVNPVPEQPVINLSPLSSNYIITCAQPVLTISVLDANNSYTWTNGLIAPVNGPLAGFTFSSTGIWTITAQHPTSGCIATHTFAVTQSTSTPVATISPTLQNITCNLTSITTVTSVANTSVNVSHYIYSPQGGTFVANSPTVMYIPGGVGIYTNCVTNDANGCSTCKTFDVTANVGFPTFSVTSPQNFTLGCTTKSIATINIINASATNTNQVPTGGPVSYTIIGPPTSVITPSGVLSGQSSYTVNVPGTWTVITKDNVSFCETRNPISVLSNTFAPDISVQVPRQVLDCNVPKIRLLGQSATSNINYLWSFPGVPGNQPGDSITVYVDKSAPTRSTIANYTLTITDNSSTCKSSTVVPMLQNLYPPKVIISNGGVSVLTCKTRTLTFTNQSTTGIPAGTGYPTNQPVVGLLWQGPTPQEPQQLTTTYVGYMPGNYTMTARDENNGCLAIGTSSIADNVIYPLITFTENAIMDCANNIAEIKPVVTNSTSAFVYSLTAPPGSTTSASPSNNPYFTTKNLGQYRVTATNTGNACASSAFVTVVNGSMTARFVPDREQGFAPLTVTFSNTSSTFTNASSSQSNVAAMTSYWNFANGTSSVTLSRTISPVVKYTLPGTYKVKMYVNSGACSDTVSRTIVVELPSSVEIPNVFTPNGDKINDVFFLKADGLVDLSLLIVDRWGHEIYSVNSAAGNVSWEGKNYEGKEVSEGIYYYTFKATGTDGVEYDKHGTITLMR